MNWAEVLQNGQCDNEPLDFRWGREASLRVQTHCVYSTGDMSELL